MNTLAPRPLWLALAVFAALELVGIVAASSAGLKPQRLQGYVHILTSLAGEQIALNQAESDGKVPSAFYKAEAHAIERELKKTLTTLARERDQ